MKLKPQEDETLNLLMCQNQCLSDEVYADATEGELYEKYDVASKSSHPKLKTQE